MDDSNGLNLTQLPIKTSFLEGSGNIIYYGAWQIEEGRKRRSSDRFYFLGTKITLDSNCHHEIKRCLFLGRKAMPNLDSVLKGKDTALPTKVQIVKAMTFLIVMYRCENWTIKSEH